MDRSSRLADLTLVSKYYPVANYSYPRNDTLAQYGTARAANDRSSLGSEGSAPGLIDDRTDSEVSLDDDYQYHAHAAELWDSFWQPGAQGKREEPRIHPRKQYPALIPSPQQRKRRQQEAGENASPAWPLTENPATKRHRRPQATYSPFPKPLILPPRSSSTAPSWTSSRPPSNPRPCSNSKTLSIPERPPRPENTLLSPCLQQSTPITAAFTIATEGEQKTNTYRPFTPISHRPSTPLEPRPSTSLENRAPTPWEGTNSIYSISTSSATDLPMYNTMSHHTTSNSYFPHMPPPPPEPQSFFEDDDSDSESESQGRSFFRFHKRSDSDTRRSARAAESGVQHRHRIRSSTAPPSPPIRQQPDRDCKTPTPGKKRPGGHVLGRMLGRRSR